MEAGVKIRDASVNPPAKPARLVWALPVAHRDIMELDMHLNLENKSYLDLGLQVLLLMLLMVLNLLLLEPYLRRTLHLRLMDMCF